ncbi:MAG: TIGR02921 family PEP-CTERM protein [Leptolyngbyaceae cyanobacterium bins.302]|nr:TIGR02921 family PEP-CTERM protein [Leptolyngbyaceae cyanobacterium bins.302]
MKSKAFAHPLFSAFFWVFNSALLLIVYAGYLPFLAPAIISDALAGEVPLNLLLPFVGLVLLPTFCTIAAAIPKWRQLLPPFQLFYGVEAPLLILCLVRFFWLRDLTSGTTLLLVVAAVGTVAVALWLHKEVQETDTSAWWHVAGLSVMLTIALYLVMLFGFYLLPVAFASAVAIPLVIYAVVLLPFFVLLFGLWTMPLGMTIVYFQAWRKSLNQFAAEHGRWRTAALTTTVLAVWAGVFLTFQQQPQNQAFALLEKPPETEQARQALVQKSDLIRQGLVNAYLAPYRYPWYNDNHVYDIYRHFLNFSEAQAKAIQDWHSAFTSPFRYRGKMDDPEKAANLYAQFFDTPILRGELPSIQTAMQSTFMRWEAKAGLLDINERRVWLAEQEVRVKPQGDWAEIELHEVYRNQTLDQQEILYYFSLPESAVVTGLWLGETGDRAKSFPYTVAPRGAAQQVYNQEVNRRVDPALLEQVGPRNYRLRAFPIPPQGRGEMHLWLTYKVLQQDGKWQLPQLHERRNLYWTNQTKRIVNGKAGDNQQWLPDALPAGNAQPTTHQVVLAENTQVQAVPFTDAYQLPTGKRFAIVLDDSYSMNAHRADVVQAMNWLQEKVLPQNSADLYLTATSPMQPKRFENWQDFDPEKVVFFGTLQPRQMLQQFLALRGETAYDAVLLLTDSGSYEMTEDGKGVLTMPAPLWLVHLGGLQPAYDDATLQAMQDSGGSSTTQVQEVMQRIGTQPTLGKSTINVVDGYAWSLRSTTPPAPEKSGFAPLAARQWITHLSRTTKSNQPEKLDAIHAIAKQNSVVTPYSSMIVLVNDRQREDLKQAEQQRDRFNREVEDQQLPQPTSMSPVSAVPEPAEWMLLLVGAIVLGIGYQLRSTGWLHKVD